MKRSQFFAIATATPLLGAVKPHRAMTTYRDTGCGCCGSWVALARAAGYSVDLHDLERSRRLQRFGLSDTMAGCHTTQIDGYLIEGYGPAGCGCAPITRTAENSRNYDSRDADRHRRYERSGTVFYDDFYLRFTSARVCPCLTRRTKTTMATFSTLAR